MRALLEPDPNCERLPRGALSEKYQAIMLRWGGQRSAITNWVEHRDKAQARIICRKGELSIESGLATSQEPRDYDLGGRDSLGDSCRHRRDEIPRINAGCSVPGAQQRPKGIGLGPPVSHEEREHFCRVIRPSGLVLLLRRG